MICNLQSNKIYGVDNNNKIITADISNYNWFEPDYKDDDENKSDYKNVNQIYVKMMTKIADGIII
jgi:hypothetical protein